METNEYFAYVKRESRDRACIATDVNEPRAVFSLDTPLSSLLSFAERRKAFELRIFPSALYKFYRIEYPGGAIEISAFQSDIGDATVQEA